MLFKDKLIKDRIPRHVAIIMDGNGRWAAQFGNERTFGHEHAIEAVRSVVEGAGEIGIHFLTLYTFSTENWSRPKEEVDALMGLFVQAISEETDELLKNNVRLRAIGDIKSLPQNVQEKLTWSIEKLDSCTGLTLVLALSYSSKWEITEAVKRIAEQVKLGKFDVTFFCSNKKIDGDTVNRTFPTPFRSILPLRHAFLRLSTSQHRPSDHRNSSRW